MTETNRPQVLTIIENFNLDIAEAAHYGITIHESVALAGAITESTLRTVVPVADRLMYWQIIVNIMDKKFASGEMNT